MKVANALLLLGFSLFVVLCQARFFLDVLPFVQTLYDIIITGVDFIIYGIPCIITRVALGFSQSVR